MDETPVRCRICMHTCAWVDPYRNYVSEARQERACGDLCSMDFKGKFMHVSVIPFQRKVVQDRVGCLFGVLFGADCHNLHFIRVLRTSSSPSRFLFGGGRLHASVSVASFPLSCILRSRSNSEWPPLESWAARISGMCSSTTGERSGLGDGVIA